MSALACRLHIIENRSSKKITCVSDSETFDARFRESYKLIEHIAYCVLGSHERVDEVVQNCRRTAAKKREQFDSAGAFRSWILRIAIDEALIIRNQKNLAHLHPANSRTRAHEVA